MSAKTLPAAPRRVRTRGTRTHADRWGNVSRFLPIESLRVSSVGAWSGVHYDWRPCDVVEVEQ